MRASIVFDVEDYISPPEEGLDDLLKMLADVMTEQEVSGTFFMIGEKLRSLRERGRSDVLQAIARHDVGSHINMGSIHPTVTERMADADWADGVARMAADELGGIREMEGIVQCPIRSLARHGGSYSPQLLAALATRSFPYVYSPARLPEHNIVWFCNTLNFYECMAVFQDAYRAHDAFLAAERKFFAMLDEYRDYDWVGIFHSHPTRIKTTSFWDQNYFKGLNRLPDDWVTPGIHTNFSMETVSENWAFHCAHLRDNPDLQVATISDVSHEFSRQAEVCDGPELLVLAQQAADADAPFLTDRFSAAEITDLLARGFIAHHETGKLPTPLPRRDVLGPTAMPLAAPSAGVLHPEAMLRLAYGIVAAIDCTGILPSVLRCGEGTIGSVGEIGIGSAMVALGQALTTRNASQPITSRPVAPFPKQAAPVVDTVREAFAGWACHRLDLDMASILRLTALQCWTLKPAWPDRPPKSTADT